MQHHHHQQQQQSKVESVFEFIGSQTAYQIDKLYQSSSSSHFIKYANSFPVCIIFFEFGDKMLSNEYV